VLPKTVAVCPEELFTGCRTRDRTSATMTFGNKYLASGITLGNVVNAAFAEIFQHFLF
jgi:hypothetical protein